MNEFYIVIGLVIFAIIILAIVAKFMDFFTKHPIPDGELQIFSTEEKDTYRFVVYKDFDNLKDGEIVKFKVYDLRDKNKANNENDRKEDIL